MPETASISRACSSSVKASPMLKTGMRSPTNIRSPTKLVRPRETHWTSRTKDVQKRLLEAEYNHMESALLSPKRMRLTTKAVTKTLNDRSFDFEAAVEASQASKEDEGYTDYTEGLRRQKEVAQCLKHDLLRENARMRLKALSLKDEVDFYYGILAKVELLAQQRRESRAKSNLERVTKLSEQIQRIISAPKPVKDVIQMT